MKAVLDCSKNSSIVFEIREELLEEIRKGECDRRSFDY